MCASSAGSLLNSQAGPGCSQEPQTPRKPLTVMLDPSPATSRVHVSSKLGWGAGLGLEPGKAVLNRSLLGFSKLLQWKEPWTMRFTDGKGPVEIRWWGAEVGHRPSFPLWPQRQDVCEEQVQHSDGNRMLTCAVERVQPEFSGVLAPLSVPFDKRWGPGACGQQCLTAVTLELQQEWPQSVCNRPDPHSDRTCSDTL